MPAINCWKEISIVLIVIKRKKIKAPFVEKSHKGDVFLQNESPPGFNYCLSEG